MLSLLRDIWPFRVLIEKKSSLIVLDETSFEPCKSKVIPVWRWKRFKTIKFLVHFKEGEFVIKELE